MTHGHKSLKKSYFLYTFKIFSLVLAPDSCKQVCGSLLQQYGWQAVCFVIKEDKKALQNIRRAERFGALPYLSDSATVAHASFLVTKCVFFFR